MAIVGSNLTKGLDEDGGSSATSASISPTGNYLIIACVLSRRGDSVQPEPPTLTGNGLTWVEIATIDYDVGGTSRKTATLLRAMGASPSAGAVTIDFSGQNQTDIVWTIDQFSGIDTGGTNGSSAIVQSAASSGASTGSSYTVTLGAFSSADNGTYGGMFADRGDFTTQGSGFTKLANQLETNISLLSEWRADNDTSVNFSGGGDTNCGGIAIEIKVAGAAGTSLKDLIGGFIPFAR